MKIKSFLLDNAATKNAFGLHEARELKQFVQKAVSEKALGIIIESALPRVFCSGGNLNEYRKLKTKAQGVKVNAEIRHILKWINQQPIFLTAAVEGACVGGGCEVISYCDFIAVGTGGRIAYKQVSLGLIQGWGGLSRLVQRVGAAKALDWTTSGQWISPQVAVDSGLCDQLVSKGQAAKACAQWLGERSPHVAKFLPKLRDCLKGPIQKEEKLFDSLWFGDVHKTMLNNR
ncbi:MAG: enoyl-CoA hydratase/isomerase family protein [Oligoflexia bacterium]|nr:enoyl-CoA hydratase/isomerase family protein [Oligoflexia bacterium]